MTLRNVDLNLLVALDALLEERHVTRAGKRVGLSQPAMSSALARLRMLFDDEILVRTTGGMQPTALALDLVEPVRQVLRQAERLLDAPHPFEPRSASLRYRVRMSDVLEYLFLPRLLQAVRRDAPEIRLDIVHLCPEDTVAALEADDLDLAVSMELNHRVSIKSQTLFRDRMVCLLAKDHPAAAADMTLDGFLGCDHLKVSMSATDGRYADAALSTMRQSRKIAVNVPHWLIAPHLIQNSLLVAVMSERFARYIKNSELVIRPLPFRSPSFAWSLYWHRRHEGSPAQRWLRQKFLGVAQDVLATAGSR